MCFPWCQLALPHAPGAPQRIPRSFAAPSLGQGCRASFAQPGWDSQACVFHGLVPSVILSRSLVVPHSGGDFHPRAVSEMKSCELQLWGAQLRSQPGRRIRGEKDPGGAQSPWRGSRRAGDGLRTGNGGTRHREWEHRTQGMAPSARELVGLVLPLSGKHSEIQYIHPCSCRFFISPSSPPKYPFSSCGLVQAERTQLLEACGCWCQCTLPRALSVL